MLSKQVRKRPSVDLVRYTCGHDDVDEYLRSGQEVAQQFDLAAAKHLGQISSDFCSILDFGCGSGRILDVFDFGGAKVSACDVGKDVAEFAMAAFPEYDVRHTETHPPLPFANGQFDLIYSFSVFSHLTLPAETVWLEELARVGAPDCAYLITVHGDWQIECTLTEAERKAAIESGFFVKSVYDRNQSDFDFPDYYEASYHTSDYIRSHWSKWFEIIDVIKGDNPGNYFFDGRVFESMGGDVPDYRPMGQDLVIARKRPSLQS